MDPLMFADAAEAISWLGGLMLVWLLVCLAAFVVWVWALVDAIRNPALDDTMRIVWVVVIVFTSLLGAIIYFLIGRRGRSRATPG